MSWETCEFDSERNIPLRESEILQKISGIEELPKFQDMMSFQNSSFFQQNYSIWEDTLSYEKDSHFESLYFQKPQEYYTSVKALQRMLIFLWYLQEGDIFWRTIYDDSWEEVSYFWIFGPKTKFAVQKFQKKNCLFEDGKIGEDTRLALYEEVFHKFHRKVKPEFFVSKLAALKSEVKKD